MTGQRITYRVRMTVEVERTVTVDVSEHDLYTLWHQDVETRAIEAAEKAGDWQPLRQHMDLNAIHFRADIMKRERLV